MFDIRFRFITILRLGPLLCVLLLFGCYPPPKGPLTTLRYDLPDGDRRQLLIFLPGNGDSPDAFVKKGLLSSVRSRNLPVDVVAVNAHIGYYMDGSVFARLKEDVIEPAKARGYKRIWLIGNSLGGYGSLSYVRQYPEDIAGIVLLGPFLGDKKIIKEISEAGGLQSWAPHDIPPDSREAWDKELWKWLKDEDQQKGFWHWVKNCDAEEEGCPSRIYLGYGKRDRFSPGQKLMAQILPSENVFAVDGGHNWNTWKKIWDLVLDRMTARKPAPRREAVKN